MLATRMLARVGAAVPTAVGRATMSLRAEPYMAPTLSQIGTRGIFSEEHDLYRETVRKFFASQVQPYHDAWEKDGYCPKDLWKAAGESGLLCVTTPEKYGGAGVDVLYAAVVWEEQSYSGCTGPGFALHSDIVAPYILHYGSEEQKARMLPKLASGEWVGAIAMTEPGAGSDLQGVRTTARKDGDHYILNGSKTFITNGYNSDVVIVVAKTNPETKAAHGTSLFLVEAGMAGFSKGRRLKKMGMAAQDTSELFFDNVRVPASALLGGENKGFYYLMNELPQERLLIADMAVAASEAAYEWTRNYVKDRKAFGTTVSTFQVTRHKMAEMKTEIAVGRAFVDQCLALHKIGKLTTEGASMAKYWTTDLQNKIVDQCVQLHGGSGYMMEYPIARAYVDARVQQIYGGTNEIMKELIARSI